ncbi:hypothetical protein EYF80_019886 [Liparis tanakae]|uniref:Uncharacterized protein n=1 Tax=Liparis tanakae TaxID=230148 RepID=A0A4Z2HVW7_9TELE|nr:hypothetical protein EYF80_019886 [Liparis tanakae]
MWRRRRRQLNVEEALKSHQHSEVIPAGRPSRLSHLSQTVRPCDVMPAPSSSSGLTVTLWEGTEERVRPGGDAAGTGSHREAMPWALVPTGRRPAAVTSRLSHQKTVGVIRTAAGRVSLPAAVMSSTLKISQ